MIRQNVVSDIINTLIDCNELVGSRVYEWRHFPPAKSDTPCVVIWDTDLDVSANNVIIGNRVHTLSIDIGVFATSDLDPLLIRQILESCWASFKINPMLSNILNRPIELTGSTMTRNMIGDVYLVGVLSLSATYYAPWGDL